MASTAVAAHNGWAVKVRKTFLNEKYRRAIIGMVVFLLLWEIGANSKAWFGVQFWWIGAVPAPTTVVKVWIPLLADMSYWSSWLSSTQRVLEGFIVAMIIGIPFGLLLAVNRPFFHTFFPVFEIFRPVPPLAWVPASIIFWPTQEMSIAFVTFYGAFFVVVINVVGGAKSIDVRYYQAARSMGSSGWDIFKRIILPGTVPSIVVGATVGMGITWEVVVAAEMISGGGGTIGGAAGGGLGFFIWNSYVGGSYPQIIVGMISIGMAGYVSSTAIRAIGRRATPWLRRR